MSGDNGDGERTDSELEVSGDSGDRERMDSKLGVSGDNGDGGWTDSKDGLSDLRGSDCCWGVRGIQDSELESSGVDSDEE